MKRGHDSDWPTQRGRGVDHADRERERATGRITQLGNERVMRADPAGNKKGTNTEGSLALTFSKSSEREGGNATTEKGTKGSSGQSHRGVCSAIPQSSGRLTNSLPKRAIMP